MQTSASLRAVRHQKRLERERFHRRLIYSRRVEMGDLVSVSGCVKALVDAQLTRRLSPLRNGRRADFLGARLIMVLNALCLYSH